MEAMVVGRLNLETSEGSGPEQPVNGKDIIVLARASEVSSQKVLRSISCTYGLEDINSDLQ
jgi:hypothetical protein